jgi:hypothetical protein
MSMTPGASAAPPIPATVLPRINIIDELAREQMSEPTVKPVSWSPEIEFSSLLTLKDNKTKYKHVFSISEGVGFSKTRLQDGLWKQKS